MMLAIVAFPSFTTGGALVARWRAAFDAGMSARVAPHVTLVSPTDLADPDTLAALSGDAAGLERAIPFTCRHLMLWPERDSAETLLFALPEGGLAALTRLHEVLHAGPLTAARRPDLPFLPHITVGRFPDRDAAASVVRPINAAAPEITGRIDGLAVVAVGDRIETLSMHPFAGSGGRPA